MWNHFAKSHASHHGFREATLARLHSVIVGASRAHGFAYSDHDVSDGMLFAAEPPPST